MDDTFMMGDYEDGGDDLVDRESFVSHRGAGEEPYYVPDDDTESANDDNDVGLDWSQADLSALMDELELMDGFSDDDAKSEEEILWYRPAPEISSGRSEDRDSSSSEGSDGRKKSATISRDRAFTILDEWYEYPYGHDFLRDFYCLQDSDMKLREDLLNMLGVADVGRWSNLEEELRQRNINNEVTQALNEILIPGLSREGLKKLHRIIKQEPSVDLRRHLENADPYLLAYIIWGLNFYMSRDSRVGPIKVRSIKPSLQEIDRVVKDEAENSFSKMSIHEKLCTLGSQLLTWLINIVKGVNLGSSYEEIMAQFSPMNVSCRMLKDGSKEPVPYVSSFMPLPREFYK